MQQVLPSTAEPAAVRTIEEQLPAGQARLAGRIKYHAVIMVQRDSSRNQNIIDTLSANTVLHECATRSYTLHNVRRSWLASARALRKSGGFGARECVQCSTCDRRDGCAPHHPLPRHSQPTLGRPVIHHH